MKNLILLSILLMPVSAFGVCSIDSIDSGESVCSLPNFREQVRPVYDSSNGGNTNINNPKLQPLKREDPINQMRGPNNSLNYNSGCQFGTCLQDPNKSRLPE